MWNEQFAHPTPRHVPYGVRISKSAPCSPVKPASTRMPAQAESFHVVHKVPVGDTPYVKAKHVQLVDKDPDHAIALFWAAINANDRVDSALKDMAIVMKQQNRPAEAIEAIKSLRNRCSEQAQESLDNVLLDLYKRCGRLDDQVNLLKHKLHLIHQGMAFNGKRTKTARSQGRKFQVSVEQEATRLLGNLGWAYMQQSNFVAAEVVYRKALSIERDNNKVCNLGICLMKQGRLEEAKVILQRVTPAGNDDRWASDPHAKSYERAQEMLQELDTSMGTMKRDNLVHDLRPFAIRGGDRGAKDLQPSSLWQPQPALPRQPRRRQNLDQQTSHSFDPSMTGALLATSGFGQSKDNTNTQASASLVQNIVCLGAHPSASTQRGEKSAQLDSWLQSGSPIDWLDEEFEYSSPEENSNGLDIQGGKQDAIPGDSMAETQQMNWDAETLKRRLETASELGNASTANQVGVEADANNSSVSPPVSHPGFSSNAIPGIRWVEMKPSSLCPKAENGNDFITLPPATNEGRFPLTFDLANGAWNGANSNVQFQVRGENRVVKQHMRPAGVCTKPFKSSNSVRCNGWSTGVKYDENQRTPRRSLSIHSIEIPFLTTREVLQPMNVEDEAVGWEASLNNHCRKEAPIPVTNHTASEMESKRQRRLKVFREMTVTGSIQA